MGRRRKQDGRGRLRAVALGIGAVAVLGLCAGTASPAVKHRMISVATSHKGAAQTPPRIMSLSGAPTSGAQASPQGLSGVPAALDQTVFHEADDRIVYNWFTYVPSSVRKGELTYILVAGMFAGVLPEDYGTDTESSARDMAYRIPIAQRERYVLLTPVLPRKDGLYVASFQREVFGTSVASFWQRPDEKVELMIEGLIHELRESGYMVADKVFMEGFSAGGMFAQRYALLHPGRVQALAAGQCGGSLTLPEAYFSSTSMDWPVGLHDFSDLVGYEFDRTSYKEIPQFICIGALDTTNSNAVWRARNWKSQEQVEFLKDAFGMQDPGRLANMVDWLRRLGYDRIVFREYQGVGHTTTPRMLDDVYAFFAACK